MRDERLARAHTIAESRVTSPVWMPCVIEGARDDDRRPGHRSSGSAASPSTKDRRFTAA
jgi:hypothetical protein